MSKFNPEDFKAPVMEPLSTVTIFDETIEWDKTAYGVVAVYGDGTMHIVDGEAYYEQPRGEYGEGSVRVNLTIMDNNIDTNVLACSLAAKKLMYLELLEECGGNEMKATHILIKRFAEGKDISVVPSAHSTFMKILNPESRRMADVDAFQTRAFTVHSEAAMLSLNQPKARPHGEGDLYSPEIRALMDEERDPTGKITDDGHLADGGIMANLRRPDRPVSGTYIDTPIYNDPIGATFGLTVYDDTDLPETKRYYRECSCKSCGAPISFYGVSEEEYCNARFKGQSPNNFTDDELERHYGVDGEIDGVIYDDTRLCSSCRAYDY